MTVLRPAASILQLAYAAMLVVVGAAGVVSARWELTAIFGFDTASWPPETQATFFNQYRFLKSVELSAGIFCLAFRPAIMAGGRAAAVFLAIVASGVIARSLAWIVDGRPATAFLAFLFLEALVFVVVALHLWFANATQRT